MSFYYGLSKGIATRTIVEFNVLSQLQNTRACHYSTKCYTIPFIPSDTFLFVSLVHNDVPSGVHFLYPYDKDYNLISSSPIGTIRITSSLGHIAKYKYGRVAINNLSGLPSFFIPGTSGLSTDGYGTPFERVCESSFCDTTFISWGSCNSVFEYRYDLLIESGVFNPGSFFEQRIRYRMLFHSPTFKDESKVYTRSNGTVQRVNARKYKIWKMETEYIPSHAVEGLMFIMAHDYFVAVMHNGPQGTVFRRMVYDNLEIKDDGAKGYPTNFQRLTGTMTEGVFNKYRSYCSDCLID